MKVALAGRPEHVKNYAAALVGVGLEPVISLLPEETAGCAGLVLPGGGDVAPDLYGEENRGSRDIDRALDLAQLSVLETFLAAGKPVLGICKGCQLLNIRFGGTLIQHLSLSEAHAWDQGDKVHRCRSLPGTLMERLYGREYAVNSLHHQALGAIGQGFSVTSFAPDGVVESVEHDALPLLGVQWHPERMCFAKARPDTVDGGAVFRHFRALLKD